MMHHQAPHPHPSDVATQLQSYSACDISDALLKLKVPGAGFVPDLNLYSSPVPARGSDGGDATAAAVTVAPVSTVLFVPKGHLPAEPPSNIQSDSHWSDQTVPGTFVVLKQPDGQKNAVCGGIMALRMKVRHVQGIIVAGRARDVEELKSTNLPIWARGLSTVGVGGGSVPWATQVPLEIDGTNIIPGDLAFSDPINGVVIIPQDKVAPVLELLPRLTAADGKVKQDVLNGVTVHQAFKEHRSNL